jgi:hypothetical protein
LRSFKASMFVRFCDEERGLEGRSCVRPGQAGGADAGFPEAGYMVERVLVLANAPGDVGDFLLILLHEFMPTADLPMPVRPRRFRGMCSMVGG